MQIVDDRFQGWFDALDQRHFASLRFSEVRHGLQALSSLYVERRGRLGRGAALDGAGKRAAFAVFYAPLHFLLVRAIIRGLGSSARAPHTILDLGCGTGAAGAGWAIEARGDCRVTGVDQSGWAVDEARWNYRSLGLCGVARRGDLMATDLPGKKGAILLAFTVNELDRESQAAMLHRLISAAECGARVLVIEPIARRPVRWWHDWARRFEAAGGRDDRWRIPVKLPERLRLLDKAAGLKHPELTGRSLALGCG